MISLSAQISSIFSVALANAYPELQDRQSYIAIRPSTQENFGHYQCNSAMRLTKILGKPPRIIAETLISYIQNPLILKAEIAGPGFINLTLNPSELEKQLQGMLQDKKLGVEPAHSSERVVVDFSSPNIAKEMHVGHLRSTIIGDCIARILEFLGNNVLRLNHVGDWGTAFGMLIAYLKEEKPSVLNGTEKTDLSHLVQWYRTAKYRFDNDVDFKLASQKEVVSLQKNDPTAIRAWEIICEISRKGFQEIYNLLNVQIIERGESTYNSELNDIVEKLTEKNLITISDGAKCVFLPGFATREGNPLPFIVQKTDGGFNYASTDLAAIRQRANIEKADRIIYVTDAGQNLHFQMLFATAIAAGFVDPQKTKLEHVGFGLVLGSDGKKFKTRSGDTERLIDLLEEAIQHAEKILKDREVDWSESEVRAAAKILGIGAVKYADLSCNRGNDYQFSYEKMLRFDGNTAAFILYAYVRIQSIKRKIGVAMETILDQPLILKHDSEIALGVHLRQFSETLDLVARNLYPNHLTDYLFQLAQKFNAFFRDCRVEGDAAQNARLLLCELAGRVIHAGLMLLGIHTLNRM